MEIKFKIIKDIQKAYMEKFEEEDVDFEYVDWKIVRAKERVIQNRLNKITLDEKEQVKIIDIITNSSWNDKDLSFKPICDELKKLGYEVE